MIYTYFSILAEFIGIGLYVLIINLIIEGKKMSDPEIWNLGEVFSLNISYETKKVDFLFHCNFENIDQTITSSIIPLFRDQLALFQTGGRKMKEKYLNENPSSSCISEESA